MSSTSELSDEPAELSPPDLNMFDFAEEPEKPAPSKGLDGPSILERLEEMELELAGGEKKPQETETEHDSIEAKQNDGGTAPKSPKSEPDSPTPANIGKKRKASATNRTAKSTAAKKAKLLAKKYEAPFVLEDSKSPLASADLRAILLHPKAWSVLTKEEKGEIVALFPDNTHIVGHGTDDARPNANSLRNDNNFRHDCARYQENIELGKHDPDWLREAWIAHMRRNRGDYDDHLVRQFENDWDVELPQAHYPKALREKQQGQEQEQGQVHVSNPVEKEASVEQETMEEDAMEEENHCDEIVVSLAPEAGETPEANGSTKAPEAVAASGDLTEVDDSEGKGESNERDTSA